MTRPVYIVILPRGDSTTMSVEIGSISGGNGGKPTRKKTLYVNTYAYYNRSSFSEGKTA